MRQIFLSPPDVGDMERSFLLQAFESNWIAPVGPDLDAFEREVADFIGSRGAVALSSGTAGLHLALLALGVGPGDTVLVPDLTFSATVNAVLYVGATPRLIDVCPNTWTIDPTLIEHVFSHAARSAELPKALVTVDLYGQCADYDQIIPLCSKYEVPIVEDAAEALGSTYKGRHAGHLGRIGVLSFNGNKIITTGGGGMLVSDDQNLLDRSRYLATQAREPVLHYEHREVGYNYRLSNLLAAVGRAQLLGLPERVAKRRAINASYRHRLSSLPGVEFMPEAPYGVSNCWLTTLLIDPDRFGVGRDVVIAELASHNIEARPTWKPMHQQPVFASLPTEGGAVADRIFRDGLCLPSGSNLTDMEVTSIATAVADSSHLE